MTRRMKLILIRPTDDSLEAFENFRKITTLKSTNSKTGLIKDDLAAEWEKFWEYINRMSSRKINICNYVN